MLSALSDYPIPLNAGIFGLMDRQAVDSINALSEGNRYLPGLRAWVGYKNAVVYYDRNDRLSGDGKLSFLSRIKFALSALLVKNPIDTMGLSITAAIFTVGGMLLLCLGVLGEYLGRVYDEVRARPLSLINKVYQSPAMADAQGSMEYQNGDGILDYDETEPVIAFKMRAG